MSRTFSRVRLWCSVATLAVAVQACGWTKESVATPTMASGGVTRVSAPPPTLPTLVHAAAPLSVTLAVTPTPVSARVIVTAAKGNVFIRRGPDLAFNPLSLLRDGQSEQALARDVLGGWVEIPFPDQAEKTGWISVQSQYTVVSGNVMILPEVEPTDWPVPASLLNCSNHHMMIDPGGIVLPSVGNFPENDVSVNPGAYVVRDTEAEVSCPTGHPKQCDPYPVILTVDVWEGSAIIIGTDGQKKSCTVPYDSPTRRCAKKPGHRTAEACPTTP